MYYRLALTLLIFVIAGGMAAMPLFGQTLNTGTFLGSVRDQSGAAVVGATVRVWRQSPPFQRELKSDEAGNYQVPQVPAGEYRLEFEMPGFQKTVRAGILLSAGQSLRVDGELTVGAVTETVQVEARVAPVDTATANVGSTVFGSQVQELSLNTRSFTQLITLQPGSTPTRPSRRDSAPTPVCHFLLTAARPAPTTGCSTAGETSTRSTEITSRS